MKLDRAQVVKLFEELDIPEAKKWSKNKMNSKILGLAKVVDEETQPEDKDLRQLLKDVLKNIEEDGDFEIEGFDEEEDEAEEGEGKKGKKGKKGEKKEKKEVAKDKFGSRVGSNNAKINAQLSKKAKSMRELVDAAGLEGTYYNHLNGLVKEGKIVKTEDGYKTKKE